MIEHVRYSTDFKRAFKQLKKKYKSLPDDFKGLFNSLMDNPLQGSELRDGMRKIRIAISSKGKGRRGGGRVIIQLALSESTLSFLYIYDKSDIENISDDFLCQIIDDLDKGT